MIDTSLVISILFLVIVVLSIKFLSQKDKNKEEEIRLPYVQRKYLMSNAERNFFSVLKEAVQDKYYIIPQVQLSKIVEVNKYEKRKNTYNNKIDRKSVDFVLFEKEYFTPQVVIELDDSSHLLPEREERDKFLDKLLEKTGIPIVHVKTAFQYSTEELRTKLNIY